MASITYNEGALALADGGTVDFASDVIECILVKDTYTPDQDHDHTAIAAAEIAGVTGYVGGFGGAGRKALTSKTRVKDNATNRIVYDADDPSTWSIGAGDTIGGMMITKKGSASDATAVLLFFLELPDTVANGSDIVVAFDATGIRFLQQ